MPAALTAKPLKLLGPSAASHRSPNRSDLPGVFISDPHTRPGPPATNLCTEYRAGAVRLKSAVAIAVEGSAISEPARRQRIRAGHVEGVDGDLTRAEAIRCGCGVAVLL